MTKCRDLAAVLADEYLQHARTSRLPHLTLHEERQSLYEGFTAVCAGGELTISGTARSQIYGMSTLEVATKAGHLAEFLGERQPLFALRPLWLQASTEVMITEQVSLFLPDFLLANDSHFILPRFCRRLLERGFNSIVLGSQCGAFSSKAATRQLDLIPIFEELHAHGIQIIIKPTFYLSTEGKRCPKCPYDKKFGKMLHSACHTLWEELPLGDYLFWESMVQFSNYRHHPHAQEATEAEIVLREVQLLEQCAEDKGLIFYVPTPDPIVAERQAPWLAQLPDDMGSKTILAFAAVAGPPSADHQLHHPLWDQLRIAPDQSATGIMPIINIGLVQQGEGLWPSANFDLVDRFVKRCRRHHFAGILGLCNHLPCSGSLLDCMLWVASQSLWCDMPTELLADTWMRAYLPRGGLHSLSALLDLGRQVSLQMSALHAMTCQPQMAALSLEEGQLHADSLMVAVRCLQNCTAKYLKEAPLSPWGEQMQISVKFFTSDVQRLLDNFLQYFNLPNFNLFNREEIGDSFWVHPSHKSLPPHAWLAPVPHRSIPGSTAEDLLNSNRLF
jgi:hypothetical protein